MKGIRAAAKSKASTDRAISPADNLELDLGLDSMERVELVVAPTSGLKPEADTNVEILFNDRRVVMAGAQNKWVRRRKIALADLIDEPVIAGASGIHIVVAAEGVERYLAERVAAR